MKKISIFIGIILCFNTELLSMVIHSECDSNKEKCIREESGSFNEDYLFMGYELHFSGKAEDLVFLGRSLTFNGKAQMGVISLSQSSIFSGEINNGIITAAEIVSIDGRISGDNYVACRTLNLKEKAIVDGNLFVGCAKLIIDGNLNGDLYIGAGEIIINNEIKGNVYARTGRIIFGENGKISGNLKYSAKEKLDEKELEKISGTTTKYADSAKKKSTFNKYKKTIPFLVGFGMFISFLLTGSLLLLFPVFRKLDKTQSEKTFWIIFLWGLILVLMYPAIIVLCFILVFTIPLAMVLLFALVPLFYLANIIGSILLGKYIVKKLNWRVEKRYYQFLIGAATGALLLTIPYINVMFFLAISAVGFGMYVSFLFEREIIE